MDNMRTRFVIAVTNRLAAAAESTAKIELIEIGRASCRERVSA